MYALHKRGRSQLRNRKFRDGYNVTVQPWIFSREILEIREIREIHEAEAREMFLETRFTVW